MNAAPCYRQFISCDHILIDCFSNWFQCLKIRAEIGDLDCQFMGCKGDGPWMI